MKKRINLCLISVSVAAVVFTLVSITLVYYEMLKGRVFEDLSKEAYVLGITVFSDYEGNENLRNELIGNSDDIRITLIDADGNVIYDNLYDTKELGNHGDRSEIKDALESGEGKAVRHSDTMNEDIFYYAYKLDNGNVLRLAMEAQSLFVVFRSVSLIVLAVVNVIIGICVFVSQMLTKEILKPINGVAENIGNTEYISPYKELEPLSKTLRAQHTDILSAAKARQDFTANVSHELKTPLTAISGYAELLQGDMVAEGQRKHFYEEIKKNADRLLYLINDIIRLSELDRKEHAPNLEEMDLYEVVMECSDELLINARQRDVELTFSGEKAMIQGNRDMIKELIENLVQNAIRYNNPGGKAWVNVISNGNYSILVVRDNGIGIPIGEQERVFERFYRVDKSRSKATGGTGLGLAIVKHIVELHDAKISLDSAPGVGTTITVTF